jgi:hypothetical protein
VLALKGIAGGNGTAVVAVAVVAVGSLAFVFVFVFVAVPVADFLVGTVGARCVGAVDLLCAGVVDGLCVGVVDVIVVFVDAADNGNSNAGMLLFPVVAMAGEALWFVLVLLLLLPSRFLLFFFLPLLPREGLEPGLTRPPHLEHSTVPAFGEAPLFALLSTTMHNTIRYTCTPRTTWLVLLRDIRYTVQEHKMSLCV